MVGVTKIGRGNAKYWIEAVAEGGEDYYTKPGEKPGQWMGELAAELGLEGEVEREAYFALLAGKNPLTGDVLVQRPEPRVFVDASGRTRRKEPILGYDVRFSAPKSVSLLWAIGSPQVQAIVDRAVDRAVRESLAHLEREACFVQRGMGGAVIERGAGFLSMGFLHRSSRAGDPALHVHVVTANMTRALSDGRWLSLANPKRQSPLLREAKSTGYVFQAVLRAELTRDLGVEWGPLVNGYADIVGFSRAEIDHFSRRRAEIVEEMAEHGTSSAAAAEVAAYRTRDAKDYDVDPDSQRSDWRSRGAEFGLSEASIERMLKRGNAREPQPLTPADLDKTLASLELTRSHFDRRDLLCALAGQMRDGAEARRLEAAVDSVLGGPRVIEIHHGEGLLGTSYFTTPRLWEMEQKVMASAQQGARAGAAVVDESVLGSVLARHPYLSAEQVAMVKRITTGGERIVAVAARPGTGKTTALRAAREAWGEANVRGIGVATARSASGELADAGVPAMSITALLIRCEEAASKGRLPLPLGTVIVMDESSTTSTPHMAALVELVESCQGKLVCIGDPRQIGAVGPGGLYGRITTITEPAVLTEIRRQRDPEDRRIVELAHQGRGSDALDLLRVKDRLVIADSLEETLDALTLDWHTRFAVGEDAVMIARRVRDVAELNARARDLLRAEGKLGEAHVTVGAEEFAVGDRLVTRVNSRAVSNRERWEVIGVDASETHLKLRRLGGDERVIITAPSYLEKRTDRNEPAVLNANALTTYATESKTFDSAFSLLDAGISREDFVVAVSRARGPTTAYGVAASEMLDVDLGPATRDIDDDAHDLRIGSERVAAEFAATEVAARKRIEAVPEHELVARRDQLQRKAGGEKSVSPAQEQLAALDTRIAENTERLTALAKSRAELAAASKPDPHELSLIESGERLTQNQLQRLRADRESLAGAARTEPKDRVGLSGAERTELGLIDDQLLRLRRRRVFAERLQPSQLIVDALGPRPAEPMRAAMWNEGVDLIVTHRQAHNVTSSSGHPLGPKPGDAARRRARRNAELRLQRIQQALDRQQTRSKERSAGISR